MSCRRIAFRPILQVTSSFKPFCLRIQARPMATSTTIESATPIEDSIREKVTSKFNPSHLEIFNDSALHRHHAAMKGNTNPETHFRITVVSSVFAGKKLPARHRMVYDLLKEEMTPPEGTIHALQMTLKTDEEVQAATAKAQTNSKT